MKKHLSRILPAVSLFTLSLMAWPSQNALANVFINELHYDNTSTDSGEAIEIAGPAGTDLTGWSIVLYNGSNGTVYDTDALPTSIPNTGGGYGVVVVNYPSNGIQNGAPDGIALVDAASNVIQFLSYEGTFTAVGGAANGMLSTDIGVSQTGSGAVGNSLQLTGTGTVYADFSWAAEAANTFSAFNTGQTFGAPAEAVLVINEIDYDQPGTDAAEFVEIKNTSAVSANLADYTLELVNGNGGLAVVYDTIALPNVTLAAGDYFVVCANAATVANCDLDDGPDTNFIQNGGPDGLGLRRSGVLVDAVSYEGDTGAPYTEGSGSGLIDAGVDGSISRCDDGMDTNQNNVDLKFTATISPGASNACPPPPPLDACGYPSIKIHDIQGSGLASALDGTTASIEGIVVGDFQRDIAGTHGNLSGFYVQEEDADADLDPLTSEGIFVYQGAATVDVNPGDHVRVTGTVDEYFNRTELTALSFVEVCTPAAGLPMVTEVNLPIPAVSDFEHLEGMYVTFSQPLVISEYFNFDRYGEIVLTSERHLTPTAEFLPGPDATDAAADFLLDRITLDDGRTSQNPHPAIHPNGAIFDLDNLFRGGDTVANVTGVMDYSFNLYRVQPTMGADYTSVNPRTALPDDVGGSIRVASFNVLNYFSTLDNGPDICGPAQNQECRGADNATEFTRQRDKIITALTAIDADVIGLLEIENNVSDDAVIDLVAGLNSVNGPGTYDSISTGTIGTDAIKVAIIYQPASVSPLGTYAILDSSVDSDFLDMKNRPVLAQSFADNASGGVFTVAVNHLKSKGSSCEDVSDPDTGDGAGNCNLTRAAAAQALAEWLGTDPTGSGDADVMIVGDLNSYDKEDPIAILAAAGYTDLAYIFGGEAAYGYVFDGQIGYLDYALASPTLFDQVSGATDWHINADEPDLIDYDTSFKEPAQAAIYAPDPYRSSDHDPVIAGLDLLHYDFIGFFKPIKNLPEVNSAKAGNSVPVKFSLAGDYGLDIMVDGYPQSQEIDCETGIAGDSEATSTAGGSSLAYDTEENQYVYVWQTEKSWSGTCQRLGVILKDGTQRYVDFQFK